MKIIITQELDGITVKQYVFGVLKLSRALVTRLKTLPDGITVNGRHETVRYILKQGDELSLSVEDKEEDINNDILPFYIELDIVFEDEHILVVNKPYGIPVHPCHNHRTKTLAGGIAYLFKSRGETISFRAVNRLDKDTSGLVIIAKSRMSAERFSKLIASGGIKKSYVAILTGSIEPKSGTIRTYIKREKESIITRCNCAEGEGGAIAITDYSVVCEKNGISLVNASPVTGRTHQLRVHFAGMNAPILGDSLYGNADERISRHALHASSLSFIHPFTGNKTELFASIPDDMQNVINKYIK